MLPVMVHEVSTCNETDLSITEIAVMAATEGVICRMEVQEQFFGRKYAVKRYVRLFGADGTVMFSGYLGDRND